jgi:subtilisin
MKARLALTLLAGLAGTLFAVARPPEDAPPPREVPVIGLPPDELVQVNVTRVQAAGPDWGVVKLKAPEAWAVTKGKGVRVAVLDTGCDLNHPDLKGRVRSMEDVKDFTRSASGPTDRQGHGTHCAGSVLADGPLPGMAPEADLIVGKVLGDNGSGSVDGIANGIKFAVARNADVISMSLGGAGRDSYIPPALAAADAAGVIVVVAAGNSGPREGTVDFPGGYPESVCIGAVDSGLKVASFSSRGPALFVAGPGVQIRSTLPGGQYGTMSGTSMATPNIAGLAALWCAAHPEVAKKDRPKAFREAVRAACKDLGPPGRDTAYGWGFPDAEVMVGGGGKLPPPTPAVFVLTEADLTPAALARFKAAGFGGLRLELSPAK